MINGTNCVEMFQKISKATTMFQNITIYLSDDTTLAMKLTPPIISIFDTMQVITADLMQSSRAHSNGARRCKCNAGHSITLRAPKPSNAGIRKPSSISGAMGFSLYCSNSVFLTPGLQTLEVRSRRSSI